MREILARGTPKGWRRNFNKKDKSEILGRIESSRTSQNIKISRHIDCIKP